MTLDTTLSKALYQGNNSATQFPFAFKVWDASELLVSVSGNGRESRDVTAQCHIELSESGGIVTYPRDGAPLAEGCTLSIVRNMPFTQGIDLVSASRFDPQVIEDGLDQATAERQQLLEQLSRAVILPPTSEQSPQEVVEEIYAARDQAGQSANQAAASAEAAKQSAIMADASAQLAGNWREQACQCADRAEQARDVALEQTITVNTLMETELAKVNAIVAGNQDKQQTTVANAKAWAENPEDAPVAVDADGKSEYSAKHWALKSSQLMAGDASKTKKGVVRIGDGIEIDQGVISVPLATDAVPGLMRPDNVTCTVSDAGVLRGNSMLCNTREALTESGSYTAPVSGWYRVTCIGGGGAGGKSVYSSHTSTQSVGKGGAQGGATSFGGIEAAGGGGGAGSTSLDGAGGGAAGSVVTTSLYLSAGDAVATIIGAGAPETREYTLATVDNSYVNGAGPGAGRFLYQSAGAGGAAGAGNGCTGWNNSGSYVITGTGGAGGTNGSGYGGGGGGGGGCGYGNIGSYPGTGGAATDGGRYGTPGRLSDYNGGNGGAGGNGAVILEYYNPDARTA